LGYVDMSPDVSTPAPIAADWTAAMINNPSRAHGPMIHV
jgi:hypothetical protein